MQIKTLQKRSKNSSCEPFQIPRALLTTLEAGKEYDGISLLLSHTSPMHFLLPISFHDTALHQDAYSPLRSQSSVAIISLISHQQS